jgi:hypothetical protein
VSATAASVQFSDFRLYANDPDITLDQNDSLGGAWMEAPSGDDHGGLPPYRCQLRYAGGFQPLSETEIAGDVDPTFRTLLMQDWLTAATTPDSAIIAAHPLSGQRIEDSYFVETADAEAEVARRQALFGGLDPRWFRGSVAIDDETFGIQLGYVLDLSSTRFGLGAGTRFVILGTDPNVGDGYIGLSGWGKVA